MKRYITEEEWQELCKKHGIQVIHSLGDKPITKEQAIIRLEILKASFDEEFDED